MLPILDRSVYYVTNAGVVAGEVSKSSISDMMAHDSKDIVHILANSYIKPYYQREGDEFIRAINIEEDDRFMIVDGDVVLFQSPIIETFEEYNRYMIGYVHAAIEGGGFVIRTKIRDEETLIYQGGTGHVKQWKDGTYDWHGLENTTIAASIGNLYTSDYERIIHLLGREAECVFGEKLTYKIL